MSAQIPGVRQSRRHPAFEGMHETQRSSDPSFADRYPGDRFALPAHLRLLHSESGDGRLHVGLARAQFEE